MDSLYIINKLKEKKYVFPAYEVFLLDLLNNTKIDNNFLNGDFDGKINSFFTKFNYGLKHIKKEKDILFNILFEVYTNNVKENITESKVDTIFTLLIYYNNDTDIKNLQTVYNKLLEDDKYKMNTRFIIFIFYKVFGTIFEFETCTNILEKNEEEFKNNLLLLKDLIIQLFKLGIISNPICLKEETELSDNQIDDFENNVIVSFYEIFIYCSNIVLSTNLSAFWLNILIELVEIDYSVMTELIKIKPNTEILDSFINYLDLDVEHEDYYELFEKINDVKEHDPYSYNLLYWINKLYIKFLKNNGEEEEYCYNNSIPEIIEEFYSKIFQNNIKIINLTNEFDTIEITRMLKDIIEINSNTLFDLFINNLIESDLHEIPKTFILSLILRSVYYPYLLLFDRTNKHYFINNNKNISRDEFIVKICEWLKNRSNYFKQKTLILIEMFVNTVYPQLIEKEKKTITENSEPECVICYEEINNEITICFGCSNCYHLKCLLKWTKQKHYKKCPICQRFIHNTISINKDEHLAVLQQILVLLQDI